MPLDTKPAAARSTPPSLFNTPAMAALRAEFRAEEQAWKDKLAGRPAAAVVDFAKVIDARYEAFIERINKSNAAVVITPAAAIPVASPEDDAPIVFNTPKARFA